MKVLSFQQPWATLVASGIKDVENRTWKPQENPGRILIHASKKLTIGMLQDMPLEWKAAIDNQFIFGNLPAVKEFPYGAIIGYATIDRIETETDSVWDSKEEGYKWILKDAYLFDEPITGVKGKLHLFDYEMDEKNLPSAHKAQLNTLKLNGDELVFPVNSELWNKISQMQGGGEYDSVVLNIDDSIVDMICRPGMYNLKPIQSIRFVYGDEMQRFEVSPVSYSYFDADANGVLYDYYSLQTKDIASLPLAGYYLDRRLAEGEAATVKEWSEPK